MAEAEGRFARVHSFYLKTNLIKLMVRETDLVFLYRSWSVDAWRVVSPMSLSGTS